MKPKTKITKTKALGKVKPNALSGDGNKSEEELKRTLSRGSIENAFRQTRDVSAVRYIVEAGDDVKELLLRTQFPSKRAEGVRMAIAAMHHLAKCKEFNDTNGEEELMSVLASLPSVEGERIKLLVEAIIGEHSQFNRKSSFGDVIKKAAFGNKDGEK